MSNEKAIANFIKAREYFLARRFAEARYAMLRYRRTIDYQQFERTDKRTEVNPEVSVVIVSYQTSQTLLDCLNSVFKQQAPHCEVILVDNGGNESRHPQLDQLPLHWIKSPINLLPSEGRNVGANFARGELLVFLDDDAIMAPGYIAAACNAMKNQNFLALRGRVLPKTTTPAKTSPKQYDMGDAPRPAELNLEGNMVIRRQAYMEAGGFDPLLFGHEGKELTRRCHARFPDRIIVYWPALVIHHDYAQAHRLTAKFERQVLAKDYIQHLEEQTLNVGISILIRAGDNLASTDQFLASLAKHNTYKPIEIAIQTSNSRQTLEVIRQYLCKFFIRLVPTRADSLSHLAEKLRYEHIFVVSLPLIIKSDVFPEWLRTGRPALENVLHFTKPNIPSETLTIKALAPTGLSNDRQCIANAVTELKYTKNNVSSNNTYESINQNKDYMRLHTSTVKSGRPSVSDAIAMGMATVPQRLDTLPVVIERLLPQCDRLYIYLNGHEHIPKCVEHEKITYAWSRDFGDLGAAGKFFFLNNDYSGYYFTVDDDFFYPEDYVYRMIETLLKYGNKVGVCVHGSIFGGELDWYFQRTAVYSSKSGIKTDKFVQLAGTGTFAYKTDTINISYSDFYPDPFCDAIVSRKFNLNKVPIVSIARDRGWITSIDSDPAADNLTDYYSKMLLNDGGRTQIAKECQFSYEREMAMVNSAINSVYSSITADDINKFRLDTDFFGMKVAPRVPDNWNQEFNLLFLKRTYQYYKFNKENLKRSEVDGGAREMLTRLNEVFEQCGTMTCEQIKTEIEQLRI